MGVFDPPNDGKPDDEYADGNILNAMLRFPMDYSFHVVGKINGEEDEDKEKLAMEYVEQVRQMVLANSSEQVIVTNVTPRSNYKFVKVSVQATVESSSMITNIYNQLDDIENTIMRF